MSGHNLTRADIEPKHWLKAEEVIGLGPDQDPKWYKLANCRGPGGGQDFGRAQGATRVRAQQAYINKFCAGCVVKLECLREGTELRGATDIWGGELPSDVTLIHLARTALERRAPTADSPEL